MNKTFILLISFVLLTAGALLVYASFTGSNQVFIPSELLAESNPPVRLRLIGRVLPKEINYEVEPVFKLDFSVGDPEGNNTDEIQVSYAGIKPDMFAPGRDVIIDGNFKSGKVEASSLLTQCPSKYEAPEPKDVTYKDS